jgi:hypothetical protein
MSSRVLLCMLFTTACGSSSSSSLEVTRSANLVEGTFEATDTLVSFRSETTDQLRGVVHLNLDGVEITHTLDLSENVYEEDGGYGRLEQRHLLGLIQLRDALIAQQPDLVTNQFEGRILMRYADRMAEAPTGYEMHARRVTASPATIRLEARPLSADADGCGSDGVKCLKGKNGTSWVYFDEGNGSAGTCFGSNSSYGGSNCTGRCGAGCNILDGDRTWDCFDHDKCLDQFGGSILGGNSNCGDEFDEAADDYIATMGSLC